MTLTLDLEPVTQTADDGLIDFKCPRCSKTVTRLHPASKGKFELKCPRTGSIGKGRGVCGWKDYVYFNVEPESWSRS